MTPIDFLEHGGGDLAVRHGGELYALADPRRLHYQSVLLVLQDELVPGTPRGLSFWQEDLVFDRWRAAWDLPTFEMSRRLAYLVDHYRPEITTDLALHARLDLGELWRERRWAFLLSIIDRLPAHSHYASAASMDEEHARLLAEHLAQQEGEEGDGESSPPMTSWTPEVAVMTNVLDAVRQVQYTLVAVNSEKGNSPKPPKPAPRPKTPLDRALQRAQFDRRKAKHEALVARVLPKK